MNFENKSVMKNIVEKNKITQVEKHQAVFFPPTFTNASILLTGRLTNDLFSSKFQPWPPSIIRPRDPVWVRQFSTSP